MKTFNKYIILLDITRAEEPVKIFDSYGELEKIHVFEEDYYFKVIDRSSIVDNYKLNVQFGDEIIFTATPVKDFDYLTEYKE